MKAVCYKCGLEKEMESHNVYFSNTCGNKEVYTYICDDCRIAQIKKDVLGILAYNNHIVSIKNLEDIFKGV